MNKFKNNIIWFFFKIILLNCYYMEAGWFCCCKNENDNENQNQNQKEENKSKLEMPIGNRLILGADGGVIITEKQRKDSKKLTGDFINKLKVNENKSGASKTIEKNIKEIIFDFKILQQENRFIPKENYFFVFKLTNKSTLAEISKQYNFNKNEDNYFRCIFPKFDKFNSYQDSIIIDNLEKKKMLNVLSNIFSNRAIENNDDRLIIYKIGQDNGYKLIEISNLKSFLQEIFLINIFKKEYKNNTNKDAKEKILESFISNNLENNFKNFYQKNDNNNDNFEQNDDKIRCSIVQELIKVFLNIQDFATDKTITDKQIYNSNNNYNLFIDKKKDDSEYNKDYLENDNSSNSFNNNYNNSEERKKKELQDIKYSNFIFSYVLLKNHSQN